MALKKLKTVLVVDDEQAIVQGLEAMLRAGGYDVVTAADGEEALAKIVANPPDAIIADLVLPKLDGWRMCQRLKNDSRYKHIPFIMLSGLLREESGAGELSLGDASLPKPCTPDQLLRCVRQVLEQVTRTETTPRAGSSP